MLFFTVHESSGICRQPVSVLPSKILVMPDGSGAAGAGIAAMLAIDSFVVGDVDGALDCANSEPEPRVIARITIAATTVLVFMAAHYIVASRRIR
jgi:hypothetical protein